MEKILCEFLDSIREYEHEADKSLAFDERESIEIVRIYLKDRDKSILNEKTFYIRRVENGLILRDSKIAFVFSGDEHLQRHIAEEFVLPEGTEHEYKFRIIVE